MIAVFHCEVMLVAAPFVSVNKVFVLTLWSWWVHVFVRCSGDSGRGSSVKTHHDLKVGAEFETHRIEELRTVFKEPFQKHVPQSWIVHCVHHYQLELRSQNSG